MKSTFVAFISQKVKLEFEKLEEGKFEDKQLHTFIQRAIQDLKNNPACGTKVPKNLWPGEYVQKYKITNLWKYDLPNAWRLMYTIEADEVRILSIILEWFNHKEYEKKFNH